MGETKRIAVIGGDGVGVEVTQVATRVLNHLRIHRRLALDLDPLPYGSEHYLRTGIALPREERLRIGEEYDGILLGAVGDPRVPNNFAAREIVLGLRFDLDLYINLRPTRLLHADLTPLKGKTVEDIQFTIIRENTEGIYGGVGGSQHPFTKHEIATAVMISTHRGVDRILRAAFDEATKLGHDEVCLVHKRNAIPQIFDLWARVYRDVAQDYPTIKATDMLVDRAAMEIVRAPEQFQTIVTSNLLGDILSDLAAQIAGGMGIAASANIHPGKIALVEPVHGSAPDIAGKGVANPLASCLSVALLLDYLGFEAESRDVERAVADVVRKGRTTPDLGGTLSTEEVGDAMIEHL